MSAPINNRMAQGPIVEVEPIIIQDPQICCGKKIDLFSAPLHLFEMELDGDLVTYVMPKCPICGAIRRVTVEESGEFGGTA